MKRAIQLPQYSDMHGFTKPDGVTDVRLDKISNLPADATCPNDYNAAFLDGTMPGGTCSRMGDTGQSIVEQMMNTTGNPADPGQPPDTLYNDPNAPAPHKKNFFKRLFTGGDHPHPAPPPQ